MTIHVIRLDTALGQELLHRKELGADLRGALMTAKREPGPVAFILREDDFPALKECADLIIDRRSKHPAKPLSAILLGYDRIPLVRGGFTSAAKLLQSVRTLLAHAREKSDGNLFLIGADSRTFAELWNRAADAKPRGGNGDGSTRPKGNDAQPGRSTYTGAQALIELLPELPIPNELVTKYIGNSVEVRLVRQLIVRAAGLDDPVLILGDTGTGKEVVARLIHELGPRRDFSFVPVNCGAIPRELLESELFGFEKGSHTTAHARKIGLWRTADAGTLFLDEIADLSADHQVKVLRALDSGEFMPVGAEKLVKADARILAATNRDLFTMVQAGQFREDLYYRLRSFMIRTPPLRLHRGDIPAIVQALWKQITRDNTNELPAEVVRALEGRSWRGNVRELKMFLSSLFGLFGAEDIRVTHLRAVFEFERQAVGSDLPAHRIADNKVFRLQILRHLYQAADALRAAQVPLREVMKGAATAPETFRLIAASTDDRVNELELLCAHPLLFHSDASFTAVRRIKEELRDFAEELRNDPERALRYWRKALEPHSNDALKAVFEEVDKLEHR